MYLEYDRDTTHCVEKNLFVWNFFQAREAVEMRAQLEKKVAQREKEKKEQKLAALAKQAREERAGIRATAGKSCSFQNKPRGVF